MCEDDSGAAKTLCDFVSAYSCVRVNLCVPVWVWLSQSSSASLQSAKVGQPNLSQGGAEELLLCFLLTVEVITSLVMQMSIPLFKLSAMQGSCQRRHIKKKKNPASTQPFFFSFFSLLSFLKQISSTWQHKHQTLMWKMTPLHQKTRQSQSLYRSLSFLSCTLALSLPCSRCTSPSFPSYFFFFFLPQPESMYLLNNLHSPKRSR